MLECAATADWKPIVTIVNHVRGTGAMYGFENIGDAAERVARAIQNGDAQSSELLDAYVQIINTSYI